MSYDLCHNCNGAEHEGDCDPEKVKRRIATQDELERDRKEAEATMAKAREVFGEDELREFEVARSIFEPGEVGHVGARFYRLALAAKAVADMHELGIGSPYVPRFSKAMKDLRAALPEKKKT